MTSGRFDERIDDVVADANRAGNDIYDNQLRPDMSEHGRGDTLEIMNN